MDFAGRYATSRALPPRASFDSQPGTASSRREGTGTAEAVHAQEAAKNSSWSPLDPVRNKISAPDANRPSMGPQSTTAVARFVRGPGTQSPPGRGGSSVPVNQRSTICRLRRRPNSVCLDPSRRYAVRSRSVSRVPREYARKIWRLKRPLIFRA